MKSKQTAKFFRRSQRNSPATGAGTKQPGLLSSMPWKALCSATLAGLLVTQPVSGPMSALFDADPVRTAAAATLGTASQQKPVLVREENITAGAKLREYVWQFQRGNKAVRTEVQAIVVDLQNPHVKLDVMSGKDGKTASRDTVLNQARHSGAVAGVNGDYFNTAAEFTPIGPQITSGTVVSSPSNHLNGMYTFGITKDNKPIIDTYKFDGKVTAASGASYSLAGINQTYSWFGSGDNLQHTHAHAIHLYTDMWSSKSRGNDGSTTPTEVLIEAGRVSQISAGQALDMTVPEGGYILRAAGRAADFVTSNLQVGDPVQIDYTLTPGNPNNLTNVSDFQMLIGGHTLLVDNGKPAEWTRDVSSIGGHRSRTAIGFSEDRRYVYLVTAEASKNSDGISLSELRNLLVSLGVWKAVNLDGGGSTQMVSRPLGEFNVVLTNETEFGVQRQVVNSVGVYTTAPKGNVAGFLIRGADLLFVGERADYSLNAYDQYYNPMDMSEFEAKWTADNGSFEGNVFRAGRAGTATLKATSGQATQSKTINIVGSDQVQSLRVDAPEMMLTSGAAYTLPVVATLQNGHQRTVPAELIDWQFYGFTGSFEGNRLTVQNVGDAASGQLVARFDGFSTLVHAPTGREQLFTDFEQDALPIGFTSYPADVTGSVRVDSGFAGEAQNRALILEYDFTEGRGTKAAYAVFNQDQGLSVEGEPLQMKVRVNGDNSLNWVRAEVLDGKGDLHRVDITRNMNWRGWKSLNVDLTEYNLAYPIKLKRIYVTSPEEGQDEREAQGAIAIDDISFLYKRELEQDRKPTLKLAVNKKTMTLDNEVRQLDQAPIIMKETTMVPIRFVSDALGGLVFWDNDEKRVTVLKEDRLVELWVDQQGIVMNGSRTTTLVPPTIVGGRTLVPLRLISEAFGWDVQWNNDEKSIILQ
ncbi:copper amine oxidase [Xylanibacillus composti]|uniref:Copper amine oxidase n=1 Tax=Xylanibacillus composti TaxID=1572762 RepID=A0A8J4M4V7_9BACL|nr:stalk domain-containing protein [Xylanibacillus composti]MDT9725928.1 copper amine oxidase [Xylanibacillus composti]GIQ71241.1 hypothetical protein XYCOK13_40650 [Xylanibacillus composti]